MKLQKPKFKYVFMAMDIVIIMASFFLSLRIVMPDFWSISQEYPYFFSTGKPAQKACAAKPPRKHYGGARSATAFSITTPLPCSTPLTTRGGW